MAERNQGMMEDTTNDASILLDRKKLSKNYD